MIKNELPYSKEDYYVGAQGNPELTNDALELVQMLSSN